MQIFILHEDPLVAGRQLCDRHVVNQTKETAQILSTALRSLSGSIPKELEEVLYVPTHAFRKCVKWAGETSENFRWLLFHGLSSFDEHRIRYKTPHKSGDIIRAIYQHRNALPLPIGPLTDFPQDLPEEYHCDNAVIAYRRYYIEEKSYFASWRRGNTPDWYLYRDPFLGF